MRCVSNHGQHIVASSFETRARRAAQDEAEEECLMPWPEPVSLRGAHARLEPLSPDHCEGLATAAKDGDLWKLNASTMMIADKASDLIRGRTASIN